MNSENGERKNVVKDKSHIEECFRLIKPGEQIGPVQIFYGNPDQSEIGKNL